MTIKAFPISSVLIAMFSYLVYESKSTQIASSTSNYDTIKTNCTPYLVYDPLTEQCLSPLCIENILKELDACPPKTQYCAETDECLPVCGSKPILPAILSQESEDLVPIQETTAAFVPQTAAAQVISSPETVNETATETPVEEEMQTEISTTETAGITQSQIGQATTDGTSMQITPSIEAGNDSLVNTTSNTTNVETDTELQTVLTEETTERQEEATPTEIANLTSTASDNVLPTTPTDEDTQTEETNKSPEEVTSAEVTNLTSTMSDNVLTSTVSNNVLPSTPDNESTQTGTQTPQQQGDSNHDLDQSLSLLVSFVLEVDFTVVEKLGKDEFLEGLKPNLAVLLNISVMNMYKLDAVADSNSTAVSLELRPNGTEATEASLLQAKEMFYKTIGAGTLVTVDVGSGKRLTVRSTSKTTVTESSPRNISSTSKLTSATTTTVALTTQGNDEKKATSTTNGGPSTLVLGIAIGSAVGAFVLVVLCFFWVRGHRARKAHNQISDQALQNMPLNQRSRLSIASYSSNRALSAGQYSYDSGVWVGPGNEPEIEVPEKSNYDPPSLRDISMTPRPSTSIRDRLKDKWNIDADTLFEIRSNELQFVQSNEKGNVKVD